MRRSYLFGGLVAIILIVVVALVLLSKPNPNNTLALYDNLPVPQSLLAQLSIPDSVASTVGGGLATNYPSTISAGPLQISSKPEVLYVGAEFCPYCAVERWGLIIALMRFGNFTGINYMTSSASDFAPNTPTFTFLNATYTSPYIAFVSRETLGNVQVNQSYLPLQQLNASQTYIGQKYDPVGSIPFLDYANKSIDVGANYNDPTQFDNKNWTQIVAMIHNSSTIQSQAIVGTANLVTAQICKIDGNMPQNVCSKSYITSIEGQLH